VERFRIKAGKFEKNSKIKVPFRKHTEGTLIILETTQKRRFDKCRKWYTV